MHPIRHPIHLVRRLTAALATAVLLQGCESPAGPATPADANVPDSKKAAYAPDLDPADFVAVVDNPYFPLIPGTTWRYESEEDGETEVTVTQVTSDTRTILGIAATVVLDRVYVDGELAEWTLDWYAQDEDGNVWYLGEETREYEDGEVVSTEGSWEAGVDGAQAGVIMWGDPAAHKGKSYRQEYYEGEAEDMGKVLQLDAKVEVPYGSFTGCLKTMDWTPLERGIREHKYYCPNVGLVLEVQPRGGRSRTELVAIDR